MNYLFIILGILVPFGIGIRGEENVIHLTSEEFEELQYMNLSANPCEDFYQYTCGNFKNYHPLKEGETLIDQFSLLQDQLTHRAYNLLVHEVEEEDSFAVRKAKYAFQACVDNRFTNIQGVKDPEEQVIIKYGGLPILGSEHLENLALQSEASFGWNDIADIAAEFGISVFFNPSLYGDSLNASRNLLAIFSDGTEAPTQFRPNYTLSYEEAIEEGFKNLKTPYGRTATEEPVSPMVALLRNLVAKIDRIFNTHQDQNVLFEKVNNISNFLLGIYRGGSVPEDVDIGPVVDDPQASVVTLKQLNDWTLKHFGDEVQLDWVEYVSRLLQYTYVDVDENFLILAPTNLNTTLYGIINLVKMTDATIVKSAALLRAFTYTAADSDTESRTYFDNYLKSMQKTIYERWEYCTRKIMDSTGTVSLALALAQEYQLKYSDDNLQDIALELVNNLQASFKEVIDEAAWMDDDSKAAAQTKAANIIALLRFPAFTEDRRMLDTFYKNLEISSWDHFSNSKHLRAFQQAYSLNMLSLRDRKAWEKSPFDVNAYYNRANNRIIFPLAMLHPIFFQGTTRLLDYSRIGMIVSHEITHGFDLQGYLYNEDGVIQPWWTTETTANFRNQTPCFVEQYSNYLIPEINSTISGSGSLNENLADNGGLRNAFRTFKKLRSTYSSRYVASPTEEFTPEQLFFVGYGTMWCSSESESYLLSLQKTCSTSSNCHARASMRVNGVVSNMEEFAEAFQCPVGSPMNPETKCRLW